MNSIHFSCGWTHPNSKLLPSSSEEKKNLKRVLLNLARGKKTLKLNLNDNLGMIKCVISVNLLRSPFEYLVKTST